MNQSDTDILQKYMDLQKQFRIVKQDNMKMYKSIQQLNSQLSIYQNKEKDSVRWYKNQKREKCQLRDKLSRTIEQYDSLYNSETIRDLKVELGSQQREIEEMGMKVKMQTEVINEQNGRLNQKRKMVESLDYKVDSLEQKLQERSELYTFKVKTLEQTKQK